MSNNRKEYPTSIPSKWPTRDLRYGWNHPEFKSGDSAFNLPTAEGEEQARLERVFRTTKEEVIAFLLDPGT